MFFQDLVGVAPFNFVVYSNELTDESNLQVSIVKMAKQ
jgi:hypothetical protein